MRKHILPFVLIYIVSLFAISPAQVIEYVGSYDYPEFVGELSIQANYAYIAGGDLLYIVDISDQENPSLTGSYQTPYQIGDISVSGNCAYLTVDGINPDAGLHIIDVSNPENPTFTGWYDLSYGYVYNLFVVEEYVYVNDHFSQFVIINASNPSDPTFVGYYSTQGSGGDVFVDGPYAYVADDAYGLHIMDISDPANPTFVGGCYSLGYASNVFVMGDYAYVGAIESGLQIADISDPANPEEISEYSMPDDAYNVSVSGNFAFVTGNIISLMVVDVSDPYNPIHVLNYDTPGIAHEMVVIDEYIYIADHYSLQILRFDEESDVKFTEHELPTELNISQNHPNPFNPSTTFGYSLPERGDVTVSIYNLLGQRIATIFEGTREAGEHTITWNASDFPSGVYFARLEAEEHSENIKMVLLK